MYLLLTSRKSVSSMQLGKEIGIRQASAWFLLHRLREAGGPYLAMVRGTSEVAEVYFDGKEPQRRMSKRMDGDCGLPSKTAVVRIRERGGRTRALPVKSTGAIKV